MSACRPSEACPDPLDPAGPRLRDHGDQWGRPARVSADGDVLVTEWDGLRQPYAFRRRLRLEDGDVMAEYALAHHGGPAMPYLWSMHPLLRLEVGSKSLGGVAGGRADRLAGSGHRCLRRGQVVRATRGSGPRRDPGGADDAVLRLEWDQAHAPWFGLWQDYGGWPPDDPRHQVAVEPTTSPFDVLTDAIRADRARILQAGEVHRWWVRIGVYGGPL